MLLSHFSRVRLCATPQMAAQEAPPSLGFSKEEHWSGLPFPSSVHESEKVGLKLNIQKTKIMASGPISSVQFSSVAQSCPTLCDPMNRSTPDLPVHHQLQEFTQTHVHRVSDTIQPSHPRSSPSPPALNLSCHQGLFQSIQFSSVQFSRSVMSDSLRPHESQHARPPCPSPTPRVHSDSHRVRDAIQPSHPLLSPSPPAPNPSQHQSLFQ